MECELCRGRCEALCRARGAEARCDCTAAARRAYRAHDVAADIRRACGSRPRRKPCPSARPGRPIDFIQGKPAAKPLYAGPVTDIGLSCSAHLDGIPTKLAANSRPRPKDAKTSAKNKAGTLTVGNNNWDMPVLPG